MNVFFAAAHSFSFKFLSYFQFKRKVSDSILLKSYFISGFLKSAHKRNVNNEEKWRLIQVPQNVRVSKGFIQQQQWQKHQQQRLWKHVPTIRGCKMNKWQKNAMIFISLHSVCERASKQGYWHALSCLCVVKMRNIFEFIWLNTVVKEDTDMKYEWVSVLYGWKENVFSCFFYPPLYYTLPSKIINYEYIDSIDTFMRLI